MKLRKDCDLLDQKLSSVYMKAHLLRGNIFFVLLNTILQIYIYTYVIYICVSGPYHYPAFRAKFSELWSTLPASASPPSHHLSALGHLPFSPIIPLNLLSP